ncbi:MAG: phytanoyl-CoA dioxygenase family protein [Boseongicola sp.]|nr:phytanoyl-CoA dioxygenase family protein [Boseongicola sp.]
MYGYYSSDACDLNEFKAITARTVDPTDIPNATGAPKNVPVYDCKALSDMLRDADQRRFLMAEWAEILHRGAGVFVLKSACSNLAAIDEATAVFNRIIAAEKAKSGGGADHFAAAGSNDRIWNSLQKLCEEAPDVFIDYHASPAIDAACEAWLGPNYQMTAQVNVVHPGGQPQQAHRDYHLGFQTAEVSATYPAHVHDLSPLMTLQGGIAHVDVSIESGPTKLLPFSQTYRPGYAAWRRDDFRAHFEDAHVQLPLAKGDAIFFSPALFHAAGANTTTDVHRMVNLLQISSPFGRAMETIDRTGMCKTLFPLLSRGWQTGEITENTLDVVLSAAAEGYAFPTNLDRDPPVGGLAPQSQKSLMKQAIMTGASFDLLSADLDAQDRAKLPSAP